MRRLRRLIVSFALVAGTVVAPAGLASAGGASAAAWLPVRDLPIVPHDIAVDDGGDAVAVGLGADDVIRATDRRFGVPWWTAPVVLAGAGDTLPGKPKVTIDGDGNAVAVWAATNNSKRLIRVASRRAGGTWSTPAKLSDEATNWSSDYAVATDRQGTTTVVWTELESSGSSTYILRSVSQAAGRPWPGTATKVKLTYSDAGNVTFPDVAVGDRGAVTVAWVGFKPAPGGSGTVKVVRARSRDVSWGGWGGPDQISTDGLVEAPKVAVDPGGNATVLWAQNDGGHVVRAASRPAGGSWTSAADLGAGTEQQVAAAPDGTLTAVWVAPDGDGSAIRTRSSANRGVSWGQADDLTTSASTLALKYPQVATDAQGDVTAIWGRFNGSQATAEVARRVGGGTWSDEDDLAVGQLSDLPVGAIDPKGHVTFAWTSSTALPGASSIFDPVAPELRDVSLPPAPGAGDRFNVSVVPFDLSAVDVRWDFGDGTSATGPVASHAYSTEGPRTITATATDAAGNVTEERWMLVVHADPGPTPDPKPDPKPDPTPAPVAPVVSGLKQNVSRWNTRRVRGSVLPVGTEFTFKLDRPAQVRLSFDQVLDGRRAGKRCAKPTRKNRKKAKCKRFQKRGSIVVAGKAGGNFVAFRGKVGGRTLRAGRYRVQVTATADGRTSKAATATFTIAR